MLKFEKLTAVNTIAQIIMVVVDHFTSLAWLAPAGGTGIPFVLGAWYGAKIADSIKTAAITGFVASVVGAFIGVVVAILMGDQTWGLLAIALPSSGIAGMLGAVIFYALLGKK